MMRRIAALLLPVVFVLFSAGCAPDDFKDSTHMVTFFAMNTYVTVRPSDVMRDGEAVSPDVMDTLLTECRALVTEIENTLSATLPESDTGRFNRSAEGITDASPLFAELLSRSLTISEATGGAFSPTLQTLTALWNVTGGGYVPTDAQLKEALSHTDPAAVTVTGNAVYKTDAALMVDFGAIGKGYAAERMIEYLRDAGLQAGLVSLGGNVGAFQSPTDLDAFTVGITDPADTSALIGNLALKNGYVSVSGDYERYFEAGGEIYHHIFDPSTGMPADSDLRCAVVIAQDGALADALSTALFVMGEEQALAFYDSGIYDFHAILVTADGRILVTSGIAGAFEQTGGGYELTLHGQ